MSTLEKGSHRPLNVTQESRHRIFVGLGWDPKDSTFGFIDQISMLFKRRIKVHDLDLSCYIYDANNSLISTVDVEAINASDDSGKIYHSGDNVDGMGGGDDEQVSIELKNLNPDIANIVFAVTIKNDDTFDQVKAPEIRIVDGYSNREFLAAALNREEAEKKSGYVFLRLYPGDDGWMMHFIDEFFDAGTEKDLTEFLKSFVD